MGGWAGEGTGSGRESNNTHLDRAAPEHHIPAELALRGHVILHDVVSLLGHARHVLVLPLWVKPETEERHANLLTDRLHLVEMRVDLRARLVQSFERRAAQLELAPRLERHTLSVEAQPDDVAVLHDRIPAVPVLDTLQNGLDFGVAEPLLRLEVIACREGTGGGRGHEGGESEMVCRGDAKRRGERGGVRGREEGRHRAGGAAYRLPLAALAALLLSSFDLGLCRQLRA